METCDHRRRAIAGGRSMPGHSTTTIRNVALIGHQGAGKTSLAEALLFRAGVRNRLGRVEDGTTVCDSDPDEHARSMSLALAVAPFEWRSRRHHLPDQPHRHARLPRLRRATWRPRSASVDLAVLVVSAVDGVEVAIRAVLAPRRGAGRAPDGVREQARPRPRRPRPRARPAARRLRRRLRPARAADRHAGRRSTAWPTS